MTTLTIEKPRFTLHVGDHLVELPEADTRDEALRKAGLTPRLWQEKPATLRHASKGKAIRANKPHSTTNNVKKTQPRITVSKKVVNKQKTVTQTPKTVTHHVTHKKSCNASGNASCENCGQLFMPLRPWSKYCSLKCRVAAFRKSNN